MRILDAYKAHKLAIGFAIAAPLSLSPAYAQDLPDPATINVPDLSSAKNPKIAKQGWKYFVFHKAGVSFEEAYADFAECYTFLPTFSGGGELPKFIPWGQSEDPDTQELANNGGNFGVVGVAIGALIEGPLRRRAYQSLDKDIWEQISGSYSLESIAIKAKIASGPKLADTPLETSR
jgi:hypothetical protein